MDIESDLNTFYDLHELIQEELEYDNSHLHFFIANHNGKETKIPLLEVKKILVKQLSWIKLFFRIHERCSKLIYYLISLRTSFYMINKTKMSNKQILSICIDLGWNSTQFEKFLKTSDFWRRRKWTDVFSAKKAAPISMRIEELHSEILIRTSNRNRRESLIATEEEKKNPKRQIRKRWFWRWIVRFLKILLFYYRWKQ